MILCDLISCSFKKLCDSDHVMKSFMQVTFMGNITTSSGCLSMEDSHQRATTSSLVIMLIEESSPWRQYVSSWLIRSSTQRTSSFLEATMSAPASTEYTASMTNVSCFFSNLGLQCYYQSWALFMASFVYGSSCVCYAVQFRRWPDIEQIRALNQQICSLILTHKAFNDQRSKFSLSSLYFDTEFLSAFSSVFGFRIDNCLSGGKNILSFNFLSKLILAIML